MKQVTVAREVPESICHPCARNGGPGPGSPDTQPYPTSSAGLTAPAAVRDRQDPAWLDRIPSRMDQDRGALRRTASPEDVE
jgi:hypothetical protein